MNNLGCKIDNNLEYFDFIRDKSPHWNLFLCFGIAGMGKYNLIQLQFLF